MVGRVTRRKLLERKNIPHELVMEILSRLPTEYLWPLRCVSKSWLQLITQDPHFAQLHLDASLKNPNPGILSVTEGVLLRIATDYTACDKAIQLELPFHPNYYIPGVICNGLLLVCSLVDNEVYIWNPLTNDYISIPDNTRYARCAFLTAYGFGFDKRRNEYKVMRALYNYSDLSSQLSLYTLGVDSSWRTIEEHNLCNVVPDGTCIPHINGFLCWLTWKQGVLEHILSFDLKDEAFQEIPPPNALNLNKQKRIRMGELGGLLCLFVEHTRLQIDIWMMKEHGVVASWTKQFRIESPKGCRHGFSLGILGLVRGGGIILKKCSNRNHLLNELSLYDPKTNSVRTLKRFQKPLQREYAFIGSLISPSAINGARKSLTKEQT